MLISTQDILSGQITLDSSLVSSLFSPEELLANFPGGNLTGSLPANISLPADGLLNDEPELTGVKKRIFKKWPRSGMIRLFFFPLLFSAVKNNEIDSELAKLQIGLINLLQAMIGYILKVVYKI